MRVVADAGYAPGVCVLVLVAFFLEQVVCLCVATC